MIPADTGAVYALLDRDDNWHAPVVEYWERFGDQIRLLAPTLPEICYLVASRLGAQAEHAFIRAVVDGEFAIEPLLEDHDLPRVADLIHTYRDAKLGFVDAAVVAISERVEATTLLTTDRRHFSLVQPTHVGRLILMP